MSKPKKGNAAAVIQQRPKANFGYQLRPESKMLDLTKLQETVYESLPESSVFKRVLLEEDQKISVNAFLERLPVWLRLLKLEGERH